MHNKMSAFLTIVWSECIAKSAFSKSILSVLWIKRDKKTCISIEMMVLRWRCKLWRCKYPVLRAFVFRCAIEIKNWKIILFKPISILCCFFFTLSSFAFYTTDGPAWLRNVIQKGWTCVAHIAIVVGSLSVMRSTLFLEILFLISLEYCGWMSDIEIDDISTVYFRFSSGGTAMWGGCFFFIVDMETIC